MFYLTNVCMLCKPQNSHVFSLTGILFHLLQFRLGLPKNQTHMDNWSCFTDWMPFMMRIKSVKAMQWTQSINTNQRRPPAEPHCF